MQQLRERLGAIPGVHSVTAAPASLDGVIQNLRWGTEKAVTTLVVPAGDVHIVLPGYFSTMRTSLIAAGISMPVTTGDVNRVIIDRIAAARRSRGSQRSESDCSFECARRAGVVRVIGVVEHQRTITPASDSREAMFFAVATSSTEQQRGGCCEPAATRQPSRPRTRGDRADRPTDPVADVQPMQAFFDARWPRRASRSRHHGVRRDRGLLAAVDCTACSRRRFARHGGDWRADCSAHRRLASSSSSSARDCASPSPAWCSASSVHSP